MAVAGVLLTLAAARPAAAAGNVQVAVASGSIRLAGDADGNSLRLAAADPDLRIEGVAGTTINGLPDLIVSGTVVDLWITLGDGDDEVVFDDALLFPRRVRITTGEGADRVTISDLSVQRDLDIDTGGGDDPSVSLDTVDVGDDLRISLGRGSDQLFLNDSVVHGTLKIGGGSDGDQISLGGGLVVEGSLVLRTNSGDDAVAVSGTTFIGPAKMAFGPGNDTLTLELSTLDHGGHLSGGGGSADVFTDLGGNSLGYPFSVRAFETVP
jgi:hypothetical protein